jgi:pilus assembly protein CpaB
VRARPRRRRALLLLSLALASGGLAASEVRGRMQQVERRVGPLVPVVVAKRDLEPDTKISTGKLRRLLSVREVPERFAPRDSLASPDEAAGLRTAVPVAAGSYLTLGQLEAHERGGAGERSAGRGERAVEVAVAGGEALAAAGGPGSRVDVLVSTEPRAGPGRSFVALENVELLEVRSGGLTAGAEGGPPEDGAAAQASAVATLRVTVRQAVYLTAAENFAREVRLLVRPAGDRSRAGQAVVSAGGL